MASVASILYDGASHNALRRRWYKWRAGEDVEARTNGLLETQSGADCVGGGCSLGGSSGQETAEACSAGQTSSGCPGRR